jgi:hypothetical protein
MFASSSSPLRWPSRIVLGGVAGLVLGQVVLRILRRAAPGPMPSRLAPVLTTPLRARLFGTPERVLDRAGVTPGMRTLRRELSARERETFVLRARVRVLQEKLDRATKVISMQQEKLEACDGD